MSVRSGLPCLLLCATGVAGCVALPEPKTPPTVSRDLTPEQAVEHIVRRMQDTRSIQAAVTIRTDEGTLAGHLWGESAGRLRIRAKKWFVSAFDLLIDGEDVTLYMPQRKKALIATRRQIGQSGGPLLASQDLLHALLAPVRTERAVYEGETLVLTGEREEGGWDRWVYDRKHLLLRGLRREGPDGEVTLEIRLEAYRSVDGRWWPGVAGLQTPSRSMEIQLDSVGVNGELGAEHFRVEIPEGTRIVTRMQDLDAEPE